MKRSNERDTRASTIEAEAGERNPGRLTVERGKLPKVEWKKVKKKLHWTKFDKPSWEPHQRRLKGEKDGQRGLGKGGLEGFGQGKKRDGKRK